MSQSIECKEQIFFSGSSIVSSNTSFELDDDIGLRRPQLSKELQEVYDTLMNFQKRDSTEESIVAIPQLAKPKEEEEIDNSDRLSDILAAYGSGRKSEEKPSKEYFIPVDYHTYQKWLHQKDYDHHIAIRTEVNVKPKATKRKNKPIVALQDDVDPGDDTSQDAADLISQESKELEKQHIEPTVKVIAHPDHVLSPQMSLKSAKPDSIEEVLQSPPPPMTMPEQDLPDTPFKDEEEERDENFVIESDLNEKLYSSESESQQQPPKQEVLTKPRKLSLSSSSSSSLLPKVAEARKPKMPLKIHTESESSTATKKKQINESEVSGPEMENDDDFWN